MSPLLGPFDGPWFEAHDEEQARLLSDPVALRHLAPFVGRERSASRAAAESGASVEGQMYWVRKFLAAGLLREVRREARRGPPVRVYSAVAAGFRVPFHLTPFADVEERVRTQLLPLDRLRNRAAARLLTGSGLTARLIYRSGDELHEETDVAGDPGFSGPDAVGSGDFSTVVRLSEEDARWLRARLDDLRRELRARVRPDGEGRPHLVHTTVQALTEEEARGG